MRRENINDDMNYKVVYRLIINADKEKNKHGRFFLRHGKTAGVILMGLKVIMIQQVLF